MWYLNPKNLLLMAAAVLIIVIGGLFLWQRVEVANQKTTIAKQAASILDLQKANADLQGQVADYKANIAAMKKAKAEQQAIADSKNRSGVLINPPQIPRQPAMPCRCCSFAASLQPLSPPGWSPHASCHCRS